MRHARSRFEFTICIDNLVALNYGIARDFCRQEGFGFLPSGPAPRPGGPDPGVADAQLHVASGRWPVIEIVSWANTATNLDVIEARRTGALIVYTPHTQPSWTLPNAERFWLLEPGFDRTLAAVDLVCCDSPAEASLVRRRAPSCHAVYIPIGIDTSRFRLSVAARQPQILMVADFNEKRKRVDLGLAAMMRLMRRNPGMRAVIAGRGADRVTVPAEFAARFDRTGFVSADMLLKLYQSSALFLLLSDYEAFGIPIVEALACGTPVVATATPELLSLYTDMPGCRLVPNLDDDAVDRAVDAAIAEAPPPAVIAAAAHAAFGIEVAACAKLEAIERLIATPARQSPEAAPPRSALEAGRLAEPVGIEPVGPAGTLPGLQAS